MQPILVNYVIAEEGVWLVLASIPAAEEKRPGIPCMRMRVHYPKKGVIRVFVDTVSKINRILFVF